MSEYNLKIELVNELRDTLKLKRANEELLEILDSTLRWIVEYCERNQMPIPEPSRLGVRLETVREAVSKFLPNENQQGKNPNDNPPVP